MVLCISKTNDSFLRKLTLELVENETWGESGEERGVVLERWEEWRGCSVVTTSSDRGHVRAMLVGQLFHVALGDLSHGLAIVQLLESFVHLLVRGLGRWHSSFGPGILLEIIDIHPLLRISLELRLAHFSELGREDTTIIVSEGIPELAILFLAERSVKGISLLVSIFEWGALSQHHERDYDRGEDVVVCPFARFSLEHLRWLIALGTSSIDHRIFSFVGEFLGETKVDDLEPELGIKHQVFHLEVTMGDSVIMAEFDTIKKLLHIVSGHLLIENTSLRNVVKKLTSWSILQNVVVSLL